MAQFNKKAYEHTIWCIGDKSEIMSDPFLTKKLLDIFYVCKHDFMRLCNCLSGMSNLQQYLCNLCLHNNSGFIHILQNLKIDLLKRVFAKNERGYRLTVKNVSMVITTNLNNF